MSHCALNWGNKEMTKLQKGSTLISNMRGSILLEEELKKNPLKLLGKEVASTYKNDNLEKELKNFSGSNEKF